MKKTIYTLFVMLLVGGLVAMGQIKPIKRQHSTKQNTEKTSKSQQGSSSKHSNNNTRSKNLPAIVQKAIDDMVHIKGGTFMMGAFDVAFDIGIDDELPSHSVTLSDYYMNKYEVTQELWLTVMGSNPSHFSSSLNCPVEQVSWDDCQLFIHKINQMTGMRFRLPTEAEWEYAARGGVNSKGYKYAGGNTLDDVAWYGNNSNAMTHPVGEKNPNELGLYDMSGNVYEWCQDWYKEYSDNALTNPSGPNSGSYRVLRGASWGNSYKENCRVTNRGGISPADTDARLGLRLAL